MTKDNETNAASPRNDAIAPPEILSSSADSSTSKSQSATARGGLALAAGKLYFLVAGLIQQILLKAVLGLGGYGAYSTASSVASISYNPLVQAGIQGVSRSVAGVDGTASQEIQQRLLKMHAVFSFVAALVFYGSARLTAEWLGAPHVASALRILSIVLFLYGVYAPLIGILNGRRRFLGQAGLDALAATLRTVGLVGGAYVATKMARGQSGELFTERQVDGAVLGFAGAAVLILLVALKLAGIGKPGGTKPSIRAYTRMVLPMLGGQILLNLLFQADALLLRKFAADAALSANLPALTADAYVGAYRATQLFCFLPFQLLTSLSFVLFPLIAQASASDDRAKIAGLVERGLRLAILTAGLIISTLVAVPGGLLSLVFGAEASGLGAEAMTLLSVGLAFFALLGVITTVMNSLGAERQSFVLILLAVVFVGVLCVAFAHNQPLSSHLLTRVAAATSLAMLLTTAVASFQLKRLTGARLSLLTLSRTGLGVFSCGVLIPKFLPGSAGALSTLLGAMGAVALYLGSLLTTRELTRADGLDLLAIMRRK